MFMLNFPNANFSSEEWCYANDIGYGIIWCFCSKTSSRLKSGARFEVGGGGGWYSLIWRGVEFYYCSSKIVIIFLILLIYSKIFYFNSKFA